MRKPLADFIRLEREKRNLTQQQLADLAGVSRWQLNTMENGKANPSLDFVVRVASAMELSEVPVAGLRLRAVSADLPAVVSARAAVMTADRAMQQYRHSVNELDGIAAELAEAAASLDEILTRMLAPGGSAAGVLAAADRLAATPPDDSARVGRALRELAEGTEGRVRIPRPEPAAKTAAKKRAAK